MCVDSILGQTYKNIEVILVDDKSPDNSGKIADEYAKKDPRVQVIHKSKNEGLNMARATGFEATSGTYIMFVDSDDAIAKDCIEFALRAIVKRKAEFAKFNVLTFADVTELPDGLTSVDPLGEEKVIIGKPDLYRSRFENKLVGSARVTVWGGLYPREVVKKINWFESDYRQFEDMHWTLHFLEHVNKGVFVSRVGYFYRVDKKNNKVLSKSLSGNSLNGSPVGYLEFASIYLKKLENYNHKYKLGIEKEIDQYRAWLWIDRLSKISKATMFTSENNLDYLSTAIETVVEKYMSAKKTISKDEDSIKALDEEILALHHEINTLRAEKEKLKEELRSLGSIKRSAHLLLDNTKRKIKTMIK
jgi:glycosyltransferase involved in cell wall biosynthesis